MTAHTIAAEIESKLSELIHDSPLNRRLYLETTLLDFQRVIEAHAVMQSCQTIADAMDKMHANIMAAGERGQEKLNLP